MATHRVEFRDRAGHITHAIDVTPIGLEGSESTLLAFDSAWRDALVDLYIDGGHESHYSEVTVRLTREP